MTNMRKKFYLAVGERITLSCGNASDRRVMMWFRLVTWKFMCLRIGAQIGQCFACVGSENDLHSTLETCLNVEKRQIFEQ